MDTSKRPRASHTRSANRSNHSSLVPVGGAAALPTERLPVTPAVVEGAVPAATVRQIVLPQHTDSAAAAAAELSTFGDWSDALGALVPSSSTLGNAVAFANAWTEQRKAAERWLAYVRENEILAWNHALGLIDVVKTPLVFATERDAALADALPATLRLVGARAEMGRKAARRAGVTRRRAAKPASAKPEAGAKAPEKEAPMPVDLATIQVVPGAQHAPIRPARRGPFCIWGAEGRQGLVGARPDDGVTTSSREAGKTNKPWTARPGRNTPTGLGDDSPTVGARGKPMREEPVHVSDIRAAMRDEAHLAWYTCLFVGICSGTMVVVNGLGLLLPEDPDGWLAVVAIGGLFPVLALLASLVMSAVYFVRWLRRAYADVTHLEGIPMPYSRSQLLWAWVIPFLNLVRPHSAVKKLAQVSHPGDLPPVAGEQETRWDRPVPVSGWWGAWIASSVLGRLTSSHEKYGWIDAVGAALTVLSGVLCVMVVRGIDARRQERMRRLLAQALAAEQPRWPSPSLGSSGESIDGPGEVPTPAADRA